MKEVKGVNGKVSILDYKYAKEIDELVDLCASLDCFDRFCINGYDEDTIINDNVDVDCLMKCLSVLGIETYCDSNDEVLLQKFRDSEDAMVERIRDKMLERNVGRKFINKRYEVFSFGELSNVSKEKVLNKNSKFISKIIVKKTRGYAIVELENLGWFDVEIELLDFDGEELRFDGLHEDGNDYDEDRNKVYELAYQFFHNEWNEFEGGLDTNDVMYDRKGGFIGFANQVVRVK